MFGIASYKQMTDDELYDLIDSVRSEAEGSESLCADLQYEIDGIVVELNRRARIVAKRCHVMYIPVTINQLLGKEM